MLLKATEIRRQLERWNFLETGPPAMKNKMTKHKKVTKKENILKWGHLKTLIDTNVYFPHTLFRSSESGPQPQALRFPILASGMMTKRGCVAAAPPRTQGVLCSRWDPCE